MGKNQFPYHFYYDQFPNISPFLHNSIRLCKNSYISNFSNSSSFTTPMWCNFFDNSPYTIHSFTKSLISHYIRYDQNATISLIALSLKLQSLTYECCSSYESSHNYDAVNAVMTFTEKNQLLTYTTLHHTH